MKTHLLPILALLVLPLRAEEVFLKNGRIMKGNIVSESEDEIVLDIGTGKAPIKRKDIERIEWGYDRQALEELKPENPKDYLEQGSQLVQSEDPNVVKLGIQLLHLASKLDTELYVEACLKLAKHEEMQKRGDPVRFYKRILMYQPANKDAIEKLEKWLEANPEKPTNTAEIRQALLEGVNAMLKKDWDTAYDAFDRIPSLPPGEPIPLHIDTIRSRTRNAARARRATQWLSDDQVKKFRIYVLHLEASSYNPFDPPGEKLPKLGRMIWEDDIDYERTIFKRGGFLKP